MVSDDGLAAVVATSLMCFVFVNVSLTCTRLGFGIPDASMHVVRSNSDVLQLMNIGFTNRAHSAVKWRQDERSTEAQHINKSLSALGDVIFALAQKSPHVASLKETIAKIEEEIERMQVKVQINTVKNSPCSLKSEYPPSPRRFSVGAPQDVVLMQTRSEKVRTRLLGLRIVKYLLENLKEGVLLPETIPYHWRIVGGRP
ncbi:hypothetical protein ACFE04_019076 [Oxalis oulophora]